MLLLVIPTMTYSKTVQVMVGTKIIDKALSLMTVGELAKATMTWRQAHFGAVMSGSLQLSHSNSDKSEVTKGATSSSQPGDAVEVWKFRLNDVKGSVHTTQKVTIPPFSNVGQTPVSRDTACECMSLQSQHLVPSCQQQWYPQLPMGNYALVLQGCQSVCAI